MQFFFELIIFKLLYIFQIGQIGQPMVTDKLLHWLEKTIADSLPGAALPTDLELAGQWKLSTRTVRRLMKKLESDKKVVRIPGKGTFTPSASNEPDNAHFVAKLSSAESLAQQIQKMVQTGLFRRNEQLPQIKYQCIQYGVSPHTVINAYSLLEKRGFIHRVGRAWFAGPSVSIIVSPKQNNTILMAIPDHLPIGDAFSTINLSASFQKMEKELLTCGYQMKMIRLSELEKSCAKLVRNNAVPHGIFFYSFSMDYFSNFNKIYAPLRKKNSQLCSMVIDILGPREQVNTNLNIEFLSRGNLNTSRARSVAEFAVSSSYKTTALCIDAAIIDQADPKPWGKIQSLQKIIGEIVSLNPGQNLVEIIVGNLSDETKRNLESWFTNNSLEFGDYLKKKYGEGASQILFRKPIFAPSITKELISSIGKRPLMLCSSAGLAVSLFDELSNMGLVAKEDVGIISLENHGELITRQISSCSIDYILAGYLLAHALIGDIPVQRTRQGYIRVLAPVLNRGSA